MPVGWTPERGWHEQTEEEREELQRGAVDRLINRCRRAETTRDCPLNHAWYGGAAYHRRG